MVLGRGSLLHDEVAGDLLALGHWTLYGGVSRDDDVVLCGSDWRVLVNHIAELDPLLSPLVLVLGTVGHCSVAL